MADLFTRGIYMILITLGTQDKEFKRILEDVEKEIKKGNIKDKVVVQAGYTKYTSDVMEIIDYIPVDEFNDFINKCDILITHGGVGSIITGLKNKKKVIAVPRLKKYGEHTNDHQLQIVENFANEGYILSYNDGDKLSDVLKKVNSFKPKKYVSNKENMQKVVKDYIDNTTETYNVYRKVIILFALIALIVLVIL